MLKSLKKRFDKPTAGVIAGVVGFLTGVWSIGIIFHFIPLPHAFVWWGFPWLFTVATVGACVAIFVCIKIFKFLSNNTATSGW